jgi:hypothetical protein
MWTLSVQICEVMGEFEQIAGKRHASRQRRWIQFGVLGLAAEVEVGKHAPSFQGLNLLFDCVFDLVADLQELIARCGSIGEVHHEEYGGLSDPIVPQRANRLVMSSATASAAERLRKRTTIQMESA